MRNFYPYEKGFKKKLLKGFQKYRGGEGSRPFRKKSNRSRYFLRMASPIYQFHPGSCFVYDSLVQDPSEGWVSETVVMQKIIDRPGVAGAVLQTASSFTD